MPPKGPLFVKPPKDVFDENYSFYGFIRRILCLYRYTGLLPISGLRNKSSDSTRGLLKSWYSIIYLATLVLQGIRLILITIDIMLSTNRFQIMDKLANMLVALANYMALFFMLRLSLKWEVFVKQVESIEKLLPSTNHHRTITFTKYLIAAFFILATIDFFLLNILIWRVVKECPLVSGVTNDYELFCKVIYSWLFQYLPFHYILVFLLAFLHLQIHLLWNYIDVFIMVVAIYLYCKFENFNKILLQKQQSVSARGVASWSTLQVHYTLLSRLVTLIDDNINPTVLLSYFSNILFVMKQIFYITKDLQKSITLSHENCLKMRTGVDTISYFTFTCCIVIARTGLISAFASNLHVASREPLHALHTFPSSAFSIDMQRLMSQVYYSRVSLTGYTFFGITRRMILAMVGTLITYELVLFQL